MKRDKRIAERIEDVVKNRVGRNAASEDGPDETESDKA